MKFSTADMQAHFKEIIDEIKIFEGINHPNLVKYYGVEVHRVSGKQTKGFLAVRRPFSLNSEFSEFCCRIANRCYTFTCSFKIPKQTSTVKFSRSPKFIFSFFRRGSLYQALMQSRSFDYLLYVLFSVLYVKADKLGKCSCPTTLTSSILYIYTVDMIRN